MLRGLIISDLMVCGSSLIFLLNLNLIFERMWLRVGSDLLIFTYFIPFIKLLLFFFYKNGWVNPWSKINIEVAKIFFPFKLGWVSHNVSIAKISFKKKTALILSMKFLCSEVFWCITTNLLASTWCCMGYCFHIAGLVFDRGYYRNSFWTLRITKWCNHCSQRGAACMLWASPLKSIGVALRSQSYSSI